MDTWATMRSTRRREAAVQRFSVALWLCGLLLLCHVEADELGEIGVAFVFHLLLDADLGRVVCADHAGLQIREKELFTLLRLALVLRHPGQDREPLVWR